MHRRLPEKSPVFGRFLTMIKKRLAYKDSILNVSCDENVFPGLYKHLVKERSKIEQHIAKNPFFATTLGPVPMEKNMPEIVKTMVVASKNAKVGPMAAVAGTIAESVAKKAVDLGAKNVMVENGGDICLYGEREYIVGIHAGESKLSDKFAFEVNPGKEFLGICTSSGSVGHSISFGQSDSVTVVAESAPIADAAATAIANDVIGERINYSVKRATFLSQRIKNLRGVLIIRDDKVGSLGILPKIIEIKNE